MSQRSGTKPTILKKGKGEGAKDIPKSVPLIAARPISVIE
jgi:hypothetical protein